MLRLGGKAKCEEQTAKKAILDRKSSNQESDQIAAKQAKSQLQVEAKVSVQPSPAQPAEPINGSRGKSALSASKSQVYEVSVDDVDHYQVSVKTLLEKVSGRLLTQEGVTGSGLLLVVELPRSHQAEFFTALKEAEGTRSMQSALGQGGVGTTSSEFQRTHDPIAEKKASGQSPVPASVSSPQKDEPTVTIQLRVLPKH